MKEFKKLNNITGWVIFAIALIVYTLTMEDSVSFWDCGEFIAGANELQVVHAPGAPFFLLVGRLFTMIGDITGNPELVPKSINFMSGLSTAFVVLFVFWITTYLGRKIMIKKPEDYNQSNNWLILGAGVVAGLSCTFLDSLWFSAVEGEVYALSMFFTAFVFWAIFKWEEVADEPGADRWLILIAYMSGLSIGVHLLNLVCLPAICLVYYFKKFKVNPLGLLVAVTVSFLILAVVVWGIIPGTYNLATKFELLFVNGFGTSFWTGFAVFVALLVVLFTAGLFFTRRAGMKLAHNVLLALTVIMIGYSSYGIVMIRSAANPPIDINNPENVFSVLSYLNREQYGSRPLVSGQFYPAPVIDTRETGTRWVKGENEYEEIGKKFEYVYDDKFTTIFPRIYSGLDNRHVNAYRRWLDPKFNVMNLQTGRNVKRFGKGSQQLKLAKEYAKSNPAYRVMDDVDFGDNIKFFFKYQMGHMYMRYFLWNFAGRQNDLQGLGNVKNGNWLSGISFIDNRLYPQANIPDSIKNHPSRNKFFLIPLFLGLLGLVFHAFRDLNNFIIVLVLFLFTGMFLTIYFNSPSVEPRERDYTLVGSFVTYTIWIGLSVIGIFKLLRRYSGAAKKPLAIASIAVVMIAPILMGVGGWDDHDRSNRTIARDMAINYLESCAPNAILFTQGDNDTYPLWYAQEVENIRPDVRIVNLSLLGVDWYINQMRKRINEADPVKFTATPDKYMGDKRNFMTYSENVNLAPKGRYIDLYEIVNFMNSDNRNNQRQTVNGESRNYFPTKKFSITIDKNTIARSKTVSPNDMPLVVDQMEWRMNRGTLMKNDIQMLDIIATNAKNGWEKPIYFAVSINPSSFLGLEKYFQLEGFTYRLVPIEAGDQGGYTGRIRSDAMYDNLMNDYTFGGLEKPGTATDETIRRMASNLRSNYARLATKLNEEGKTKEAIGLLDKGLTNLPNENIPYDFFSIFAVEAYYEAGSPNKAVEVSEQISENLLQDMEYVKGLPKDYQGAFKKEYDMADLGMSQLLSLASRNQKNNWALSVSSRYDAAQVPAFKRRK